MRVKTAARRQMIILEAWKIFREQGYERTTMSEIATRLGGSKGTLYGYFGSKEELLLAAIDHVLAERGEAAFDKLSAKTSLSARLHGFAQDYLALRTHRDTIALDRILIAEAGHSNFGKLTQERLLLPQWHRFAGFLSEQAQLGHLVIEDADQAAAVFRALISHPFIEQCLFSGQELLPQDIHQLAQKSVAVFLKAYAPQALP
jgi:AcrR family transcriptional regulator